MDNEMRRKPARPVTRDRYKTSRKKHKSLLNVNSYNNFVETPFPFLTLISNMINSSHSDKYIIFSFGNELKQELRK